MLFILGFAERIHGDHHFFTREGGQPKEAHAKPFQVKQVRNLIRIKENPPTLMADIPPAA